MPKLRLRSKFILLLLSLAVIPLLLVSIINIYNLQNGEKGHSLNLENKVAQLVTEQVKSFISMQFAELEGINTTYSQLLTDQSRQDSMDIFLFKNPNFIDIAILDKAGNEIVHKNAIKIFDQKDLINRKNSPEFTEIEQHRYFIGPLYFENGKPYMQIGQQLIDNGGEFNGEIIGIIDVRTFQDVVKQIAASNNNRVYIVDHNGIVVAHPDISVVLGQKNYSNIPSVKQIINHNTKIDNLDFYTNDQGQQVIGMAFPIQLDMALAPNKILDTHLIAVSEQLSSVALYPVEQITRSSSIALILVVLGSIVIALIYSNIIISPIEKVHLAAQKLGLGDFEARASVATKDEIEDLANSFNQMAESLKKSIVNMEQDRQLIAAERNKLQVALSAISDAVIAVDLQWKIILVNKAALTLTGLTAEQLLGNNLSAVIRVQDSENQIVPIANYCPIRTDNFEGITFNQAALKVTTPTKEFVANLIASQIKEGPRVNMGGILTFHDVTGESQLEEMKMDFVSMAAHELRTPLTSIRSYLSVFIDENSAKFTKDQNDFLTKLQISANQLSTLIERLLTATKVARGIVDVNLELTNWLEIVRQSVDSFKIVAAQKQINLTLTEPNIPIGLVKVDKVRINEVLSNLLNNAISYTKNGGQITISIYQDQDQVITSIQDTGEGIDPAALPHLFTKFFRAWGKLEMSNKGTGLGLYISKAIINKHNGRIWAESTLGKGSTFSFSLPIAQMA